MIVQSLCDEGSYPNNLDSWKIRVVRYDLKNVVFLVQGAKQSEGWIESRYIRKKLIRSCRIWIEIRSAVWGICDDLLVAKAWVCGIWIGVTRRAENPVETGSGYRV